MTATAHGRSGADATDAVDALVRQLEAQLAGGRVVLGQMSYAPTAATASEPVSGAELTFELSFTVPEQMEPQG